MRQDDSNNENAPDIVSGAMLRRLSRFGALTGDRRPPTNRTRGPVGTAGTGARGRNARRGVDGGTEGGVSAS